MAGDRVGKVKIPLRGEKWVSTGVAARLMDVTRRTVSNWASLGLIVAKPSPGGRYQVLVADGGVVHAGKQAVTQK